MEKLKPSVPSFSDDYEVPVNLNNKTPEHEYSETNLYSDIRENGQHYTTLEGTAVYQNEQFPVSRNSPDHGENTENTATQDLLTPKNTKNKCYKIALVITLILCFALATSTASFAWLFVRCQERAFTKNLIPSAEPSNGISFNRDSDPGCPPDFVEAGKCYFLSSVVVTRPDAERFCRQKSSDLLQITSKYDFDDITSHMPDVQSAGNIANRSDSTCSASSEWDENYSCTKAIDGRDNPGSSEWVIRQENAVGSWLKIDLDGNFEVNQVQILRRCHRGYQSKGFKMIFSDNSEEQGQLRKAGGSGRSDCRGVDWQVFNFASRVTSYVKIVITSVYNNKYNGLREVKVIGRPVSGFWTKGRFQDGSWLWGQLPLAYEQFESGVETSAENGDCLSMTSHGYFPSSCNNIQKRKFICVKIR